MTQRSGAQGKILIKLLGVLVGLAFVVFGFNERSSLNRIKKLGRPAIVEPIATYTEFKKSGSSTYTAEFHFKTDTGREIVQKHSFPSELIADFKSGVPVRVFYMPNDPSNFVFEKEQASWLLVIVGGVLAVAALLLA